MEKTKSILKFNTTVFIALFAALIFAGCEKDKHIPPNIALKTGTGYTSADASVGKNVAVKVGITADKVEDDMVRYNVSYAFDGATTTTTSQEFTLTGTDQQHYDKDVTFNTRNQAGSEKWLFTITDKDGNIAQKVIVLTVQ